MAHIHFRPGRLVRRTVLGIGAVSVVVASCASDGDVDESSASDTTAIDVENSEPVISTPEPPDSDSADTAVPNPGSDAAPTTGSGSDTSTGIELSPTQQSLADVAIADLVERRSVDVADIVVAEVDEVTWSDSSLGCPQKGMQYLQVITPGIRVVLEVDDERAFYHGTSAADLAYCAAPQPPIPN